MITRKRIFGCAFSFWHNCVYLGKTNHNNKKGSGTMVEQDTIKLLRECDAGVKMGISSIDDVLSYVREETFKKRLSDCKHEHEELDREIQDQLTKFHDDGKDPAPIAKGMSWMKTNMKLSMHHSDKTVADLMTDGCNMGVKSLSGYLTQYKAASEKSKDIAKKLIAIESELGENMRPYL